MTSANMTTAICGFRRSLIGLALLWAASMPRESRADLLYINSDFENRTGQTVNDYHIVLVGFIGSEPPVQQGNLHVTGVFTHTADNGRPGAAFTAYNIIGQDSNMVTINFSGATLAPGDWTHIGFSAAGPEAGITQSYWTLDGAQVGGNQVIPPGVGVAGNPNAPPGNFVIKRMTFFDAPVNGNVIGHEWAEVPGNAPDDLTPFNVLGSTLYASTAYLVSPTLIPLDQLNENLTGFSHDSPVITLQSVPEPASIVLMGLGGLVLLARRGLSRRIGESCASRRGRADSSR